MDMSLPEQLVWAAAYVQREQQLKENNPNFSPEERVRDAAVVATLVVTNMRSGFRYIAQHEGLRTLMGRVPFDHLRQMTYKSED